MEHNKFKWIKYKDVSMHDDNIYMLFTHIYMAFELLNMSSGMLW
jgi:hypothetical protein